MPLTADQQRLIDTLNSISEVDAELDYMTSQQEKIDARRKTLSIKRVELEGAARLAHAASGYPRVALPVRDRILCFDPRSGGVISFPSLTPVTFAVMSCRNSDDGEDAHAVDQCQSVSFPGIEEDA